MLVECYSLSICCQYVEIQSFDLITEVVIEVRDQLIKKQAGNTLLPVRLAHSKRQNITNLEMFNHWSQNQTGKITFVLDKKQFARRDLSSLANCASSLVSATMRPMMEPLRVAAREKNLGLEVISWYQVSG